MLVAGCGSVGSYVAEQLARSGVGAIALLDPEVVEAANLSRTAYEVRDLGQPKVEALARRLLGAQPALRLSLHACTVDALGAAALDAEVRAADLVLAAATVPAQVLTGAACWGVHMALTQGLFSKLVADVATERLRGTAFGAFHLLTGVAVLLASLIAGTLWSRVGPGATFYAGAVFAAVAMAGVVGYRRPRA